MIKKKDIVEHISQTSELNKRQARIGLETGLQYIHERLSNGEDVQIPPLGKLRVVIKNEGTEREKTIFRLNLQKPRPLDDAQD